MFLRLQVFKNGTIFWTDEARTTLKDGGFYAYGLGNVADVYGSLKVAVLAEAVWFLN